MTVNRFVLTSARIAVNLIALINLLVTAFVTLVIIDVTVDPDPSVRAFQSIRWKLLTCWFNIVSIVYLILCLYCDWRERHGNEPPHVAVVRHTRDVLMTSILFPITSYSDILFWVLYTFYPEIIAPVKVFQYLPIWSQHSLHTVSMVIVVLDLILTPRKRPQSMRYRLALLYGFASAYCITLYVCFVKGEMVYSFLEYCNTYVFIAISILFHIVLTCFYYIQWPLIEYCWGEKASKLRDKNKLM